MLPGEHPRDEHRHCEACGTTSLHEYAGTAISDGPLLGFLDDPRMREADHFKCTACDDGTIVPGRARPDLDADSFGWVIERREARDTEPAPALDAGES